MEPVADRVTKIIVDQLGVEEEFGIEIPDEDAEKITRVKEAVDYIEKHGDKAKK